MSLSDLLNISRTVRRDKARQQDLLPAASSSTAAAPARLCNICYAKPATYNCPRCNIPFCSTVCFRRREHQDCSNAFASSAVAVAEDLSVGRAEESDRRNVAEMLGRLERNEKEARQMQHDKEDENSDDDEDDDEDAVNLRADITAEQIENASTDALLAMLTPKERQKFMDAVKDPKSAAALLMDRLDRKAERRARLEASSSSQGVLVTSQSPSATGAHQPKVVKGWQTLPWFDTPHASLEFSERPPKDIDSFVTSLEKILMAERNTSRSKGSSASVNLVYNLCAVLMAYAYMLRRLDVASLSARSCAPTSQDMPASKMTPAVPATRQADDDDEPPPLEPDSPTGLIPAPISIPSSSQATATSPSHSQSLQDQALPEQAFDQLNRLVPFLFAQPALSNTTTTAAAYNDHSKLLLTSLDDASMWLLSRLSLESEVGPGGADAINLQLLQDLAKLFTHERLVPAFGPGQEVEPKFRLASKLASLSPQQAFAAAQTPLLLNAIADIYFFLEDLSTYRQPKSIKLAQRKLCFYLCSALTADQKSSRSTMPRLDSELQDHVQKLSHRIDAANQADKIAAAVNLFSNDSSQQSHPPSIEAFL